MMLRRGVSLVRGVRGVALQAGQARALSSKGKKGKKEDAVDSSMQWHVRLADEYRKAMK